MASLRGSPSGDEKTAWTDTKQASWKKDGDRCARDCYHGDGDEWRFEPKEQEKVLDPATHDDNEIPGQR